MLVLIKEDKTRTRKALAEYLAVHRNTIREWITTYESGGFTALLQMKSPGAPSGQRSLPKNVLAALGERLKDTSGFGSYVEPQTWLKETHSVSIRYKTLHRIVRYQLQAKPNTNSILLLCIKCYTAWHYEKSNAYYQRNT